MNYIEALNNRYSVKKFDDTKKISSEILNRILQAGKLSASSLGLQPYKILVVETESVLKELIPTFYNPSQISTCSHLIVIVSKKNIEPSYLDGYFRHITEVRDQTIESLQLFRNNIEFFIDKFEEEHQLSWAEKQSYIVLGNLMFAAALENVDTCPMEGFMGEKMEDVLGLDTKNEKISVTLALGYRAEDDAFQHLKKVRKPDEKLFKFI